MLAIEQYLTQGKTFDDLINEYSLKATYHPTLPLVILNYNMIKSPKLAAVTREARGIVFDTNTKKLVAKGFDRFFNWGEVEEEMRRFDFNNFTTTEKLGGSYVLLYCYNGQWMANTRSTFGLDKINDMPITWWQGFCQALGIASIQELDKILGRGYSYVCEFCSPYNKVVREYKTPQMYLLAVFKGEEEVSSSVINAIAYFISLNQLPLLRPEEYKFSNTFEIINFLNHNSTNDPTFEGVVIRDRNNCRYKIKSPTYLAWHHMKGSGDDLHAPKNLLPFILNDEIDELLTYFPEVTETYYKYKDKIDKAYIELVLLFNECRFIDNQKTFALKIVGKTPFTSILFQVRKKYGRHQTIHNLYDEWRNSQDLILKKLFE
jgi:hypothetical protein